MHNATSKRFAGRLALAAAPIALISFFLGPAAYAWDFDAVFDPVRALTYEGVDLGMVRWGWMLDIVGYYFLLLPVMLVLHDMGGEGSSLKRTSATACGIGYLISGSMGAAMLAASTGIFERYATGDAMTQAAELAVFLNMQEIVFYGIWNILCMSLFAVWGLTMGAVLRQHERLLGLGLQVIGLAAAIDVFGTLLHLEWLSMTGLFTYLFGFPIWCAFLGVRWMRAK